MKPAHVLVLSVLVGVGFAVSYILRGHVLPGIVGGVLAAILLYVAIGRFDDQRERRNSERR